MKLNEPGKQKVKRQILLAVGEPCFGLSSRLKESTLDGFRFSVEGIIISAFAVPHRRGSGSGVERMTDGPSAY